MRSDSYAPARLPAGKGIRILAWCLLCLPAACQNKIQAAKQPDQLLFGDLHVHTLYSFDAYPLQIGFGFNNPPDKTCAYAKSCAALDFFALTDHAESLWVSADPEIGDKWQKTLQAVQQCNATAGNPLVFAGFEWTSSYAAEGVDYHWGHRNVVLYGQNPPRPVAAMLLRDVPQFSPADLAGVVETLTGIDPGRTQKLLTDVSTGMLTTAACDDLFDQDPDCLRVARTPARLFAYLDRLVAPVGKWAGALVIPHGTSWGIGEVSTSWDDFFAPGQFDERYERIIEVFSGHGNSETDLEAQPASSAISDCSDRAAQLTLDFCRQSGKTEEACTAEAGASAQSLHLRPEYEGYATAQSWGTCDQCVTCFQPAQNYQNSGAVQKGLKKSLGQQGRSRSVPPPWGLVASTDGHRGQPGSVEEIRNHLDLPPDIFGDPSMDNPLLNGRDFGEGRRLGNYLYAGGLAAVWVTGASRRALWDALQQRRVYGTSGPRIELQFRASAAGDSVWMGDVLAAPVAPVFEVDARGAPLSATAADGCYHPQTQRAGIERIEITRVLVRQGRTPEIRDPWQVFVNPDRSAGGGAATSMHLSFSDDEWHSGEQAYYYVRVIQEATVAVNGNPMHDLAGKLRNCSGRGDDSCPGWTQERAWSSPILLVGAEIQEATP